VPQLIPSAEADIGLPDEDHPHGEGLLTYDLFSEEFGLLGALYDRMETMAEASEILALLNVGKRLRRGTREWTKGDLQFIIRWRHMEALMSRIGQEANTELRLAQAFKVQDEQSRTAALCRIPGVGPVLASVLLTLTFPNKYAPLDNHTWSALSSLGFELRNRPFSGGGYTIPELLRYLRLTKALAKIARGTPWETAKALYALDQVRTRTKWKREFDSLKPSPPILAFPSADLEV
jgi:hypothetical protein